MYHVYTVLVRMMKILDEEIYIYICFFLFELVSD